MSPLRRASRTLLAVFLVVPLLASAPEGSGESRDATPRHDPDHILVGFRDGVGPHERADAHAQHGGRVENRFEWLNVDVVRIPEGREPVGTSASYERAPGVAYAHPNWEVAIHSTPDDTLYGDEWGLHNTGQVVTGSLIAGVDDVDIDAPEGWDLAYGAGDFPASGGTRVGVLDTGIDQAHADLLGKTQACANAITGTGTVLTGCADDNGHGTHVAGTIGAVADNGIGVAGVAPNAEFAVFKALDAAGVGFYADVIAGIHWLHTTGDADIISMSIGGPRDAALEEELTEAAAAGTLLIAAAGNSGDDEASYPAYHEDVMSVAALDAAGELAWFSTCNSDVEIIAPGVDIWSTWPGNSYLSLNGTSMATPHVSGVAAVVMWSQGADAATTRKTLRQSTERSVDCRGHATVGLVNLALALGGSGGGNGDTGGSTEPGAVAGTVADQRTKAGIGGATVDCGSGYLATTADDGSYRIDSVEPGSYTCTASATGYHPKDTSVTVQSAETTTANFRLRARR